MSRFLSTSLRHISPYVPGEQPKDQTYTKLNTNECPYPPAPEVSQVLQEFQAQTLRLYPEVEDNSLGHAMARRVGLDPRQVFVGGGSDEVLAYAFWAFFDRGDPVCYPNISYGFYKVYADLMGLHGKAVPLREDFSLNLRDYADLNGHIFIANPNAPTGICIPLEAIEEVLQNNPDRLIVVDEAYIDFANQPSCIGLISKYDNLLVVQTFSKSRSLAGMRIGFGFGNRDLIAALERVKFSFNPYNMDSVSIAVGIASIHNQEYMTQVVDKIICTRESFVPRLKRLGFEVLPSTTNFVFARLPGVEGGSLVCALKQKGILVRNFEMPIIKDYLRISIGTDADMDLLLKTLGEIL